MVLEGTGAVAGALMDAAPLLSTTDPLLLGIAGTLLFGAMLAFLRQLQSIYQVLLTVGVYASVSTPIKSTITSMVGDRPRLAQGGAVLSTVLGARIVQSLLNTVILISVVGVLAFLVITLADGEQETMPL